MKYNKQTYIYVFYENVCLLILPIGCYVTIHKDYILSLIMCLPPRIWHIVISTQQINGNILWPIKGQSL